MRTLTSIPAAAALAAILLTVGCEPAESDSAGPELPGEMLRDRYDTPEPPVAHIIRRAYRIREGDLLEVIYHVRHQERNEAYRIKIEDVISVRFPFDKSLNQVERVQSDGKLYLDLIGPVEVVGQTIRAVEQELRKRYGKYVKKPVVTVSFKESNVKIAELKKAITTAPRGQSRLVPVTPDGTISVPFVVSLRAAGKTIEQLHRDLNAAYESVGLDELEVTVNVQTVAPFTIYVLGEVRNPGAMETREELTLLQALAQAGGELPPRAELSRVLLVRRRHLPRPSAAVINCFQLLNNTHREGDGPVVADMASHKHDIWLEDGDLIYVPTTEIAKRADYVDYVWRRTIRNIGGFTSAYTIDDSWDLLKPNP
jgi:polysaccharide export outer membrane protein